MKTKRSIKWGIVLTAALLVSGIPGGYASAEGISCTSEMICDSAKIKIRLPEKKKFNHGHSITETSPDRPREIKRSYDIIHDADEALDYLKGCVELPDDLKFKLADTSDDDPGAYMWYKFIACYKGIEVENAEFTVIAFTDGTIAEGRTEFLTCSFADKSEAIGRKKALSLYAESTGDKKKYKYKGARYFFSGKGNIECPYVYLYRYNSGTMFENCTLIINAATGEFIGKWADAIS